jgi:hypothetical protein
MKKSILPVLISCVIFMLSGCKGNQGPSGPAGGSLSVITFQKNNYPSSTYAGCADTYLYQGNPTINFGDGPISVGTDGNAARLLIRFDISALSQSNVTVSKVYLTFTNQDVVGSNFVTAYALTRAFTESGATWDTYNGINSWTGPGAQGDYNTTPASDRVQLQGAVTMLTIDAGTVQSWINNPAGNYGLLLKADNETTGANYTYVYSNESVIAGTYPKLTVYYTIQ